MNCIEHKNQPKRYTPETKKGK